MQTRKYILLLLLFVFTASIVNDALPARQPIHLGKGTINDLAYIAEGTQIAVGSSEKDDPKKSNNSLIGYRS